MLDVITVMFMLILPVYGKLFYLYRKVGCIDGKVKIILKLLLDKKR